MAAEFFSLMTDSSIPDNTREALASYDTPLFARSCNNQDELAALISHLMEASGTSAVGEAMLPAKWNQGCGLEVSPLLKRVPQAAGSLLLHPVGVTRSFPCIC